MTEKEILQACKLLPRFIKVCENELGEVEHKNVKPITDKEEELIEKLLNKANFLNYYVDRNVFVYTGK